MWTLRDLFMFLSPAYKQQIEAQRQRERERAAGRMALPPQTPWYVSAEGPYTLEKLMWNDPRFKAMMTRDSANYLNRMYDYPRFFRPGEESQSMQDALGFAIPWKNYHGF
jgi:hypothetical protein